MSRKDFSHKMLYICFEIRKIYLEFLLSDFPRHKLNEKIPYFIKSFFEFIKFRIIPKRINTIKLFLLHINKQRMFSTVRIIDLRREAESNLSFTKSVVVGHLRTSDENYLS